MWYDLGVHLISNFIAIRMRHNEGDPASREQRLTGKYSIEKWREAPEETLDRSEREFLEDYAVRMDELVSRINEHPSLAWAVLREATRLDTWHILLKMGKAGALLNKQGDSKEGQLALSQHEAEQLNEEYDRRAKAVRDAIDELSAFIQEVNGRKTFQLVENDLKGLLAREVEPGLWRLGAPREEGKLLRVVKKVNQVPTVGVVDQPLYTVRYETDPTLLKKYGSTKSTRV